MLQQFPYAICIWNMNLKNALPIFSNRGLFWSDRFKTIPSTCFASPKSLTLTFDELRTFDQDLAQNHDPTTLTQRLTRKITRRMRDVSLFISVVLNIARKSRGDVSLLLNKLDGKTLPLNVVENGRWEAKILTQSFCS